MYKDLLEIANIFKENVMIFFCLGTQRLFNDKNIINIYTHALHINRMQLFCSLFTSNEQKNEKKWAEGVAKTTKPASNK